MDMKTPYYVIHKTELEYNYQKLIDAIEKNWNNYIVGYSYKTNALPWVIKYFDSKGCYAETVSEDEYNLAKLIGVSRDKIIYNGPVKTQDTFLDAMNNGCIVNIDSRREIDWLENISIEKRKVGVRVNFDIETMCPGQSQCPKDGGRFGFCYENGELQKVIEELRNKNAQVVGLHLHTSSKSRGLDIYAAIARIACKIQQEYDLDLEYIDVGGGFFGGLSNKPQFEDYFSLMGGILSERFDKEKTKLIIEPGMAVIGSPVSYITTVIDVKDTTYNRFVVTDGSRTSIDPLMTKQSYFYSLKLSGERKNCPKQVICGYTCMEHDRLFEINDAPVLKEGDIIVYDKVGAYTMCLTPLFIKYFPDVYVEDGNEYKLVRNAWGPKQYIMNSIEEE